MQFQHRLFILRCPDRWFVQAEGSDCVMRKWSILYCSPTRSFAVFPEVVLKLLLLWVKSHHVHVHPQWDGECIAHDQHFGYMLELVILGYAVPIHRGVAIQSVEDLFPRWSLEGPMVHNYQWFDVSDQGHRYAEKIIVIDHLYGAIGYARKWKYCWSIFYLFE